MPAGPVVAVRDVSLDIAAGDYLAVRGPSGCGKSTLLHMLGCVDTPSEGTLLFEGRDVAALSDRERSLLRLRSIGFVFQRFFLLPMLTRGRERRAAAVRGRRRRARPAGRARASCSTTSACRRARTIGPSQLSGGEMQRVAIARALANQPRLLLADEPTGELDQATGEHVAELLDRVNADGTALVIVTHDHTLASRARRVLTLRDGARGKRARAMIGRLALRSLTAHPVRSAVLAVGFGVGVAVMAILLGVAEVVLQQAQSPELVGGGDVVVAMGRETPASLLLAGTLQAEALRAPYARRGARPTPRICICRTAMRARVSTARGGIPSLERALGDPETAGIDGWRDTERGRGVDARGRRRPRCAQVDRFHPIPDAPAWRDSWAEWLYFNGRGGDARFYLTFLVGPRGHDGRRAAGVRLQLERGGRMESFSDSAVIDRGRRCPGARPDDRRELGPLDG